MLLQACNRIIPRLVFAHVLQLLLLILLLLSLLLLLVPQQGADHV
jgi:hypothetical protein